MSRRKSYIVNLLEGMGSLLDIFGGVPLSRPKRVRAHHDDWYAEDAAAIESDWCEVARDFHDAFGLEAANVERRKPRR